MTPSEKERIIEEGFDAIRKFYNLRDDLLEDAGKLEAAKESNRKLSDRVANLEVTIKTLNAAIDKKDAEIKRLKAEKHKNEISELESGFHELRQRLSKLYLYHVRDMLETKDMLTFADWFKDTFGDFGIYDEEE